jgi:photosystem II stability/assembly factor-like uncharacterized protein
VKYFNHQNYQFTFSGIARGMFFMSFLICFLGTNAQKIEIISNTSNISYRGLSVVNDNVIWLSGNKGTIQSSIDGGKTFDKIQVKGFEKNDFRDIQAFDSNTAVIMAINEPALILRTENGGKDWKTVFSNTTKGMFLDAMDFNANNGVVIGDPIDGHFFLATSNDKGKNWKGVPEKMRPVADSGEACFASSGTNIRVHNLKKFVFISGGLASHFYCKNKKTSIPILQGKESTGANSIAFKNKKTFIVVGGDFLQKDDTDKNCVITNDGGKTWRFPKNPPSGYRSCIEYLNTDRWITCGLNGVDISNDNGETWTKISDQSFHVVGKAKKGNAVYLAGNDGKIGKLIY